MSWARKFSTRDCHACPSWLFGLVGKNGDLYIYRRSSRISVNPAGPWSELEKLSTATIQSQCKNIFTMPRMKAIFEEMHCSSCSNSCTRLPSACHAPDSLVQIFPGNHTSSHAHPLPLKREPNNISVTVKLLNLFCRSSLELSTNTWGQTDVFSPSLVSTLFIGHAGLGIKQLVVLVKLLIKPARSYESNTKYNELLSPFSQFLSSQGVFRAFFLLLHIHGNGQLLPLHSIYEEIT